MMTILLTLFTLFFIGYSIFLYRGIKAKDNLNALRGKLTLGIMVLFLFFLISLSLLYANLSSEGYGFKTNYSAKINPETKSVMVGTDKDCDIQIFNRFSDSEHIVFDFNKEPVAEIISKERSAIVNNKLITLKEKKLVTDLKVKDGDIFSIDNRNYKIVVEEKEVIVKEIEHDFKLFKLYGKSYTFPKVKEREVFIKEAFAKDVSFTFKNEKLFVNLLNPKKEAYLHKKKMSHIQEVRPKEMLVKDGDIIRLGYSDYKLHFTDKELRLDNIFFRPTVINLFNIYATTTIPNFTKKATGETVSVWWIFLITVVMGLGIVSSIFFLMNRITEKFAMIGDNRYILYPILYFTFFLTFLLFASIINFTVLQYQQFSVYNKGALYTVLLVYGLMLLNIFLARLGYNKNKKSTLIALGIMALIIVLPWLNSGYIYSSRIYDYTFISINKTIAMTSLDLSFIFLIFGFGFGRLVKNLLSGKESLFLEKQVNIKPIKKMLGWSIVIAFSGLVISFIFNEGAGIVLIETIKLLIFFLFTVVLLDDFEKRQNKFALSFFITIAAIPLMIAIVLVLKDMGSLMQVIVAIIIISFFFYNRLKEVNIINKKMLVFLALVLVVSGYFVVGYIHDNIRLDMWIAPFEQTLEVENNFYMYYYEQIARGLYLIKEASLFPNDFIGQSFTPLPNLHTDFIFAMYVNIFGMLGFFAIVIAFIITILSFTQSIHLFQNSKRDIYRFIYGVNVIFVAYLFSYIIINMLSVLQIFPLTDVPFPILTYGRGVLILFFVLYVFVGVVNYLYLDLISKSFKGRV